MITERELSTGVVTHKELPIWNGLTVDQAIEVLLDKIGPTGQARQRVNV